MTSQRTKDEYLDKDFDYTKLTKQEMRAIMSENGIEDIPPATALKSTIMEAYKTSIHDRRDSIRSNFSGDNIFQKKITDREHTSSSFISNASRHDNKSSPANSTIDASNDTTLGNNKTGKHSSNSSNIADDESEVNSTAFNRKPKLPFIAIPKRKTEEPISKLPVIKIPPRNSNSTSIFSFKRTVLLLFLATCCYLKFYYPYCGPGMKFCAPLPTHSKLVNGILVCDSGFKLQRGIVDICVSDVPSEYQTLKRVEDCVRLLEYLKGDYNFGYAKSPNMKLSLISDPAVLSALKKSPRVVVSGDTVEAIAPRTSIRVFLRFYSLFLLKIWLGLVIFTVLVKLYMRRRRRIAMMQSKAGTISKEILDILNRQIMMSVKSTQFKPHVLAQQIKDALDIKDDLWKYIEGIIQKNSNVEKIVDDQGKAMWKWIGPVLYKTEPHIGE